MTGPAMNRTFVILATAVALVVLVVGIWAGTQLGTEDSDEDASDRTSEASSSSVSDSAAASSEAATTATPEQYASLIARHVDLQKRLNEMENCDWLGTGPLDADPAYFVCRIGLYTLSLQAQTLALDLETAQDPDRPKYLGEPPAELVVLVDETHAAAKDLQAAAKKTDSRGCGDTGRGACLSIRVRAFQAIGTMRSALRAWAPYI